MTRRGSPALPAWLAEKQDNCLPVISTRIRLARNFKDLRFPPAAGAADLEQVLERFAAFARRPGRRLVFRRLQDLSEVERGLLAERGLVQMDTVEHPNQAGLAVGAGDTLSLLLNEEDHLRIQVLLGGLKLNEGLKLARRMDAALTGRFRFATHRRLGYLTACPTNVGTGLRASVMVHLPGLALTGGIVHVLQAVLHMGLAVRGIYGEGTELRSVFFQISNQVTLGRTEDEIIKHLLGVTRQIVEREEEARRKLQQEDRVLLEDKVGRALGILAHCRQLGLEEGLELLSTIRLGAETKLLGRIDRVLLNELLLLMQPAHLQARLGAAQSGQEQNQKRAELIQAKLGLKAKKSKR